LLFSDRVSKFAIIDVTVAKQKTHHEIALWV